MNLNEPIHTIREVTPRSAVIDAITAARERFFEAEQMHRMLGNYEDAEGAHQYALWCQRALDVERDNPVPEGL